MNRIVIIVICSFFSLFLVSCGSSDNLGEINKIKKSVDSMESIVKRYDSNVQSAMDTRNLQHIDLVGQEAIDSADIVVSKLKIMAETASKHNKDLIDAAILYSEALYELIRVEQKYSSLLNTTSANEAKRMDDNFIKSSQKAKEASLKYFFILGELTAQ